MEERRMSDGTEAMDARLMDAKIVGALEAKPEVRIPAGFAARVAGQLPSRRVAAVTPLRYGLLAMRIAMAVLAVAMVVLAAHAVGRTALGVALEWTLCAELVAIGMWLGGLGRVRTGEG
jgi:hypothetical protein